MYTKRLTIWICILIMFTSISFANTGTTAFKDLSNEHWAYDSILKMIQSGILTGYPEGDFKPNQDVTRGEFAKMMVLALHLPLDQNVRTSFTDLTEHNWVVPYVEAAKQYLTGFISSDGYKFKPDAVAVREDMAVALVKALKYPLSSEDKIKAFSDYDTISPNLRIYVATAYEKGIMKGSIDINGNRLFNAQSAITRAEASVLLMNVIVEEKITFDDIKVPLDGSVPSVVVDQSVTPVVTGSVLADGSIKIQWNQITAPGFQGYKVVASPSNDQPSYPDDGYYKWITTASTTSTLIKAGAPYNGGDVSTFKAGNTYYFTVTAVYDDVKKTGNVLKLTLGDAPVVETSAVKLSYTLSGESLNLNWTTMDSDLFQGYKVVASTSDSTPKYPDNGYFRYITDASDSDAVIKDGLSYVNGNFKAFTSGQTYYFAITTLFTDGTSKTSNVIQVKIP